MEKLNKFLKSIVLACLISLRIVIPAEAGIQEGFTATQISSASVEVVKDPSQQPARYWAKITFYLPKGWHTYYKIPGDVGKAPTFTWNLPKGIRVGELEWPPYETFKTDGFINYGYTKTLTLKVPLLGPLDSLPKQNATLNLKWLICKDSCIPQKQTVVFEVGGAPSLPLGHTGAPPTLTRSMKLVVFAFLGGILLNVMPCVLPVISLKLLHLLSPNVTPIQRKKSIVGFVIGVWITLLVLAAVILSLKQLGLALGWGFQLQSPFMIAGLAILFLGITLNLWGVFEVGAGLTQLGPKDASLAFWPGVLNGILTTVVATPCSAPFLGTALGVALTQPGWLTWVIFSALALGLSAPLLLLSTVPGLHARLPKPGPWMQTFKQSLGFLMALAVGWLLWVLSQQNPASLWPFSAGLLALGALLWVWGKIQASVSGFKKWLVIVGFLGVGWVLFYTVQKPVSLPVKPTQFSQEYIQTLLKQGHPVLVDVTAAWCLTCQVNEKAVLNRPVIQALFKQKKVTVIKADWTHQDEAITAYLKQFNRSGVPLYVWYEPDKAPVVWPDVLTLDFVKKAVTL